MDMDTVSSLVPSLLLKVHVGEGFRLSFDLEGHILDLMSSRPQTETQELAQAQTQSQSLTQKTATTISTATEESATGTASGIPPETRHDNIRNAADGNDLTDVSANARDSSGVGEVNNRAKMESKEVVLSERPIVYFAEGQSDQDILDLCNEAEFQRQLADHTVSIVQPSIPNPAQDRNGTETTEHPQMFSWEWTYNFKDHVDDDLSGQKGVFAVKASVSKFELMHREFYIHPTFKFFSCGTIHISPTIQVFIKESPLEEGFDARKVQHQTTVPASHNSLPSLPDAATTAALGGPIVYADTHGGPTSSSSSSSAFPPDSEDGPVFRATVVECENHIRDMKAATKKIIKAAQTVLETRKSWVAAEEIFVRELETFKPAEPLLNNYMRPMIHSLAERSETLGQQMRNLLVEPLTRFYGNDLKAAETQRKSFDEESKEYYTFLSRYMAMKQDNNRKKSEADAKYEKKRRHFEIKRFEYWGFLLEMRVGGSKSDEILHHLTNYSEKHCRHIMDMALNAEGLKPSLDEIAADLLESHKRAANLRKERQERKRELFESYDEGSSTPMPRGVLSTSIPGSQAHVPSHSADSTDSGREIALQRLESIGDQSDTGLSGSSPGSSAVFAAPQVSNNSTPKFSGIRDLEHQDIDAGSAHGRRKEGFLFATSRPSMHNNSNVLEKPSINWHKYWCVVSEGHLHEYSHWKKGATMLHNEPINLKISTVRSCRNQDRRFCFEVITPRFRRVYQATSTEDMNSWINVISNAIQSLLNGTSSHQSLITYAPKPGSAFAESDTGGVGGTGRSSMDRLPSAMPISIHDRKHVSGSNELGLLRGSAVDYRESDHLGTRLLQLMREANPSNSFCAECGAKNPDWCAINLGILICIECSGIHRSLGTHISKVRSFTLDTTSYTRDLFDFIRAVGNEISKQIWEANLVQSAADSVASEGGLSSVNKLVFRKPVVNDSREYKVSFIQKKYVERAFVDRQRYHETGCDSTDLAAQATKTLFKEAHANNIIGVIAAFAAGANLNAVREIEPEADNEGCIVFTGDHAAPAPGAGHVLAGSDGTNESSIPYDSQLQASLEGMSMGSEASSRFSRSTVASSVLNVPGANSSAVQGLDGHDSHTFQMEMSESSFMVMQTSPLLLALRHGVSFSLDDQYEVYPLAEFMIQNGAASNLSVEVRLVEEEVETTPVVLMDKQTQAAASRVSEGEGPAMTSALSQIDSAALEAAASWESPPDPEDIKSLHQRSNRRSLGQVVNMRGEGGNSAMEYLRAKSAARGEVIPVSPPGSQSPPSGESVVADSIQSSSNQSTLSPCLLSQNHSAGAPSSLTAPNPVNSSSSVVKSTNSHRHQPSSIHQDISSLFQKRLETDGGVGPAFFATERVAREHQSKPISQSQPTLLSSIPQQQSSNAAIEGGNGSGSGSSSALAAQSRAHKVKATLSKSLRLSAAYIKNNMMKDEKEHHHPPIPTFTQPDLSPAASHTANNVATVTATSEATNIGYLPKRTPLHDTNTSSTVDVSLAPSSAPTSSSSISSSAAGSVGGGEGARGSTHAMSTAPSSIHHEAPLSGPYVILHKKGSIPPVSMSTTSSSKDQ
ncbi:hypothetical protein BG004_001738 [Podila humilis]|nr:hypothetical protein BG004_001738 [Podila humilis]